MLKSVFNKKVGLRACNFIIKRLKFARTPPVAASENQIAEEVRTLLCLYDKGNRTTKKTPNQFKTDSTWDDFNQVCKI